MRLDGSLAAEKASALPADKAPQPSAAQRLEAINADIATTSKALNNLPYSPTSRQTRVELKQHLEELIGERDRLSGTKQVSKPTGISDADYSMLQGKMELLRTALVSNGNVPPKRSTLASNEQGFMVCREQADMLAKFLRGGKVSVDTYELPALKLAIGRLPPGYEVKVVGNRNRIADIPAFAGADTQHAWVEVRKGKDVVSLDMWANKSIRGEAPSGYAQSLVERVTTYRAEFPPLE